MSRFKAGIQTRTANGELLLYLLPANELSICTNRAYFITYFTTGHAK